MSEFFAQPDDLGEIRASELHTSLGESLGAQFGESFMSGTRTVMRGLDYVTAAHPSLLAGMADAPGTASPFLAMEAENPDVSLADAKARVKQEGLDTHVKLPEQPSIKQPVLDLMIAHGHERADYEAAVSRGPQGFIPGALGFATSIGAGLIDPVNIAAFSIPVLGEARWGKLLLDAGESLGQRAGVRALQGGLQGAVGGAALLPADWWLHTKDGQDYTMGDALKSVVLSAGMGAVAHAGHGAWSDVRTRRLGLPLPGSPEDQLTAALEKVPPLAQPEAGIAPGTEAAPGVGGKAENAPAGVSEAHPGEPVAEFTPLQLKDLPPDHPARVLADLPPAAQEDVVRASIANVIQDKPNNAAEMLHEAAKVDPRIAESVNGGRGPKEKGPQSLLEFIAAHGGVSDKDPLAADLLQSFGGQNPNFRGFGRLVRPGGKSLDAVREAAIEAGYIHDAAAEHGGVSESTINDLLSAVDSEARGQRQYPAGQEDFRSRAEQEAAAESDQHAREQFHHEANQVIDAALDDHEITTVRKQLKARAFSIMEAEGSHDPIAAIERAIDEFGMGRARDAVPGEQIIIPADNKLSGQADWKLLADERVAYDDPAAVAESKEAAATPEPASIEPEKAPSAAEAAAKDADALLADIKPKLSEEEWRSLEDNLNTIADDKSAREQIVRDGAACLAEAMVA